MSAELHALFDRDVFIKLACCDLWKETLTAFCVTHPYRLAAATPRGAKSILRRMKISDHLREETLKRLETMAKTTPILPEDWINAVVGTDVYNSMLATSGIDAGEAELALVALSAPVENCLITGDKNFINAMKKKFPEKQDELRPRLITFDACLLKICEMIGFKAIRERLIAARECDGTLKIALGCDNKADAEAFYEALRSFNPI